jgi:hypothetical protein
MILSNRFGQTRFVPRTEACEMLDSIFNWPIDENRPELGYCPVVLMGHALSGDLSMLSSTLGVHAAAFDTVVKIIDTQSLCIETDYWHSRNKAGLHALVPMCNFEYRNAHTASNDAAMTLICAIQMVLPDSLKSHTAAGINEPTGGRSLQDVIDKVEVASQAQTWTWGAAKYCVRCGRRGHTHTRNGGYHERCKARVKCTHCTSSTDPKRKQKSGSHATKCCIMFAMKGPEASLDSISAALAGMALN